MIELNNTIIRKIIFPLCLFLGFFSCDSQDVDFDVAMLYLDHTEGVNFFCRAT